MIHFLAEATTRPSAGWTPENITALVAAVVAGIIAIIGALKGTGAQAQATANSASIGRQSTRMDRIESDQKHIALATPPPHPQSVSFRPPAPSGVTTEDRP